MLKDPLAVQFLKDKENTITNLEMIQTTLNICINQGMMDENGEYYNKTLDLIDEAKIVKTYPELAEVIAKAKGIETDIDAWLSLKLRETLSISWPVIQKT
jgi:hypothetical protein